MAIEIGLADGHRLAIEGGSNLPQRSDAAGPLEEVDRRAIREIRELDGDELHERAEEAAEELNGSQQLFRSELEFEVHEESGRTIIRVSNPETEEVIREVPPEEIIRLAQILQELSSNGDLAELSLIRAQV